MNFIYCSPIGPLLIEEMDNKLAKLSFWNDQTTIKNSSNPSSAIQITIKWLDIYFSGRQPDFIPECTLQGTSFQKEVWAILKTIPYGKTMSYGSIASLLARKRGLKRMSAQAIGNAIHNNPIAIIIPCHRVIGSNGSLVGYAGGLEKKIYLLSLENDK